MVGSAKAVHIRIYYVRHMVGRFNHNTKKIPRHQLGEAFIRKDLGKAIVKLF